MAKNPKLNSRTTIGRGSTTQTFNLRKKYLNKVVPTDEFNNFFDSSLTPYYGKVDRKGNAVYPSESHLAPLRRNTDSASDTVYVMNFVAEAFHDLQDYFNKARRLGILVQDSDTVQAINPVKGWQSVHTRYSTYIKTLYNILVSSYLEKPSAGAGFQFAKPKNFDQYMESIKHLYSTQGSKLALSRSSYILSSKCPRNTSGLIIEITPTLDYSDDASKNFTYIESSNFKFYMHALNKFGFMADKEYPGRIIADLGSPKMQNYMASYNLDIDTLFESMYYKAKDYDYDIISVYLMQFYNNYVASFPVLSETSMRGTRFAHKYALADGAFVLSMEPPLQPKSYRNCIATTGLFQRSFLSDNDLATKYNQDFWLPLYAEFLNYELGNPLNENQLDKTIKNAKDLKKSVDFNTAIGYIGDKFNFYRYPLSDLALANYEDTGKTSSGVTTTTTTTSASPSNGGGSSGTGGSGGTGGGTGGY